MVSSVSPRSGIRAADAGDRSSAASERDYASVTARSLCLDVLRMLAVLLVLGHHDRPPGSSVPVLGTLGGAWRQGGWIGVDLFFVLSGFLISSLLFREWQRYGRIRYGYFVLRRGLKIYPAFYTLLLTTVLVGALSSRPNLLESAISEALFVQNYGPRLWGHTWSLAVEEHFYLLLPPLLILLARKGRSSNDPFRALPLILAVLAVTTLGLRLVTAHALPFDYVTAFFPTHLRLDALMFGVCLSYLFHFRGFGNLCRRYSPALVIAGVGLLLPAFWLKPHESSYIYTLGFTQLSLGASLLLAGLSSHGVPENALTRAAGHLGSHSYSVYLWHLPVKTWGVPGLEAILGVEFPGAIAWLVYMGGSIGLGVLMARTIEWPVLRLRDRLLPSRSQPIVEVSTTGAPVTALPVGPVRPPNAPRGAEHVSSARPAAARPTIRPDGSGPSAGPERGAARRRVTARLTRDGRPAAPPESTRCRHRVR